MFSKYSIQASTALLLALGLSTTAVVPMVAQPSALAQTQSQFSDVPASHWASQFITSLAASNIIAGFPDGQFRPDAPVTRAQFAAMVRNAFSMTTVRSSTRFVDVPADYWAASAIDSAYRMGFLSGYPDGIFQPNQNIPRSQVLVSLANGLNYQANSIASASIYSDSQSIPGYATGSIAAATEQKLVVNYPNVQSLRPNQVATRADVAAFIYQALASQNRVATVSSPYIVQLRTVQTSQTVVSQGTALSVAYDEAPKIVLLPDETLPLTLRVTETVRNSQGQVLIPANSQVEGELRPSGSGSQFVADTLVLSGSQRLAIQARSGVVTTRETVRRGANLGEVLAGAALGSAAAAVIAEVTGDSRIDVLEILAGTATGTVGGLLLGRDRVEVIAVEPATDLTLVLQQPLTINP